MFYPGLEGKNVLAIGGNSNLGQHISRLFAQSGANVVIAAQDVDHAKKIADDINALHKGKVSVVDIDATSFPSVENAVAEVQKLGSLDIVYQGIAWDVFGSFLELDPAFWDKIYEVNLKSVMIMYRTVLPIMIAQRSGSIVTMGSVLGRVPAPTWEPVYGAMKAGVMHLARAIATDVAEYGVRVNVVAPGATPPVSPDALDKFSTYRNFMSDPAKMEAVGREFLSHIPLNRFGTPENVAHAVLYLASPVTGGFQTGQILGVDGGQFMPY
ncbi:SDR family NAD(P)-dependent oxidoreductase [Burkholderia gladioli]|uniref:SDR family NAD(P)-dependent oxidoreductase n=1 Tax=Burkholderia gladioli TaxID=28095 RepID=UPI00164173B2|nr:SDR family NAD(P)-dependent oxidoreductase [Burkholderia gladioli]